MKAGSSAEIGVEAVRRACERTATPDDLLTALSTTFHRYVPHDASIWMAIDPVTLLSTAPSRVEGLDAGLCDTFWHLEFHEHDTGHLVDLARGETATAMGLELGDRVGRSPRYREFMSPQGYGDELRGMFRSGVSAWGVVSLYRETSRPRFDLADVAFVKAVSKPIGDALRIQVRTAVPWLEQPSAPGLIVVDRSGNTLSANEEAVDWLNLLWPQAMPPGRPDTASRLFEIRDLDSGIATPLHALLARARAVAAGRERASARLRLRDGAGRWIVLHASPVVGPDTATGDAVAVIIEAAKSSDIAPLVMDAYSLTPREQEVLGAIARGSSTSEIAVELVMSPHTVRDHIKAVFDKVGVSSRGELVARLFGEYYSDRLHETMIHAD